MRTTTLSVYVTSISSYYPLLVAFVSQGFAILDVVQSKIIKHDDIPARVAAHAILQKYLPHVNFTCQNTDHIEWGRQWAVKITTNVFFKNKRKHSTDSVREDTVVAFKLARRANNR